VERNNDAAAAAASVDHGAHASLLDDLMARVAPCFTRRETRLNGSATKGAKDTTGQ
jgi:hypothetical protein